MMEDRARMNLLVIHVHRLKGSDLLAHKTRITYQKVRYTSIRNNFYNCSIVSDPLHTFLRIPLHIEVFKFILLRMKQL
jgi:hypothetical protein